MLTTLALSLTLAAPVPAPAAPIPAGTPPRLMELKADANGKVMVQVYRSQKVKVQAPAANAPVPGNDIAPAVAQREVWVSEMVEIGEVKDLTVTTADGKKLTTDEALKRLTDGTVVVISGDGKPVSPVFLKVFKDDTLVLVSPELAGPENAVIGRPVIGRPGIIRPLPPVQVQPLPAPVKPLPLPVQPLPVQPNGIQVVPAQAGGVIQIQIGGGVAPAILPAELPQLAPAVPAKTQKNEK